MKFRRTWLSSASWFCCSPSEEPCEKLRPAAGSSGPDPRPSSVLVLRDQLSGEADGLQANRAGLPGLGQNRRVDHGHVDVEVVGLLKALAAGPALEGQVGLGFVLGHVILEGRPLAALEAANLTPAGQEPG